MKRFLGYLLIFLIFCSGVAFAVPTSHKGSDKVQWGRTAGNVKVLEALNGASPNPTLSADPVADEWIMNKPLRILGNSLDVGDSVSSDKTFTFDKGLGATNPLFRWLNSAGKLQFCDLGAASCINFADLANRSLDNLTSPTAINQSLLVTQPSGNFDVGQSTGNSFQSFHAERGFRLHNGGGLFGPNQALQKASGGVPGVFLTNQDEPSSDVAIGTKDATGATNSQPIDLETGNVVDGISGDITVRLGVESGTGSKGKFRIKDGSEGNIGEVWTSNDVSGGGGWESITGGANVTLSNLTSTAINASLLPATPFSKNLGVLSSPWDQIAGAFLELGGSAASDGGAIRFRTPGNSATFLIFQKDSTNVFGNGPNMPSGKPAEHHILSAGDFGIWTTGSGFDLFFETGNGASTANIESKTGDASAGNSGDFIFETGTATGTRGTINFLDGSEGVSGKCWVSSDTGGSGNWETCPGGAGGGGTFSIIVGNDSNFEDNVGAWGAYDDGAVAEPVDGDGGAPSVISIARDTTPANLINGTAVGLISKTAADGQGEGVSLSSLDLPVFFRGRTMQVRIKYKTLANYENNYYRVFAFDQTGTNLLAVLNNNGGDGSLAVTPDNGAEFNASITTELTTEVVRLIIHGTTTSAVAFDVSIDDVKWEEISSVNGPIMEGPVPFTPTWLGIVNITSEEWQYTRVGSLIFIEGSVLLSGVVDALIEMDNPIPNTTISRLNNGSLGNGGAVTAHDNGTSANSSLGNVLVSGSNKLRFFFPGNGTASQTVPFTWASTDVLSFGAWFEIDEWENGAIISSNQANVDVLKVRVHVQSGQNVLTVVETLVDYDTLTFSTHGSGLFDDAGTFTAPFSGFYFVNASIQLENYTASEVNTLRIKVNGSETHRRRQSDGATHRRRQSDGATLHSTSVIGLLILAEGDTVTITTDSISDANYDIANGSNVSFLEIFGLPSFKVFGVNSTPMNQIVLTSDGTYKKPPNLVSIMVEVIGGGGGSQSLSSSGGEANASKGGGGGGYSRKLILASDLSASETVTIGLGGAIASAGGTTSFGSHLSATGGGGGLVGTGSGTSVVFGSIGPSGGSGSSGEINLVGARGGRSFRLSGTQAEGGWGGSAAGPYSVQTAAGTGGDNGLTGTAFGSGSGGGVASNGGSITGGVGAAGATIITEHF